MRPAPVSAPAAALAPEAAAPPATLTVGVEEELMLLDPRTLEPLPAAARVLAALGDDARYKGELAACAVEIVTPVCAGVDEALAELRAARRHLVAVLDGRARIAGVGAHPVARGVDLRAAPRNEKLEAEYGWAARRGARAFGLHIHVGLAGAARRLAVHNAVRSYLPEIAALAGNAPGLDGADTGLASVRPTLADALPRQGVPPAFASLEELASLVAWGRAGGADRLWWEVRPHPSLDTLEVRVPDQQARVEDSAAVAAVVHALVARLAARVDRGEAPVVHDTVRIQENRWRALRGGLAGTLLDLDTGRPESTRARVARLLDDLEPLAGKLGGALSFGFARRLLARNGAERQRDVLARGGMPALLRWLADETEAA